MKKDDDYLPNHLLMAKILVYDKCGFDLEERMTEAESQAYGACSFRLNGLNVKFRVSNITPTKTGQFVAIWKRNAAGITEPFNCTDEIDFVIISSKKGDDFGQFIFPKAVLLEKGIMADNNQEGKRGIRVYPPWDTVTNKQAEKTQQWQAKFFLTINQGENVDFNLARQLLADVRSF